MGSVKLIATVTVLNLIAVLADNPVKTEITVGSNQQKIWDLRDKSSSSYSSLSNEQRLWDDNTAGWSRISQTACDSRRIGTAFEFKTQMLVHEVRIKLDGDDGDDYDDNRMAIVYLGNSAGFSDQQFGDNGRTACSKTDAWEDTDGWWILSDSSLSRSGKYLSVVAKSDDCDCGDDDDDDDDRRRLLLETWDTPPNEPALNAQREHFLSSTSHGRRLASCGSTRCAKLEMLEAYAFQYSCPSGTYPLDPGSSANGNCADCPSGFWCPGGVLGQAAAVYKHECPSTMIGTGTRKATQAAGCRSCEAGTIGTSSGCEACASGSFCPEGATTEQPCPLGRYCPTPAQSIACPLGSTCASTGLTTHSPCPSGVYCDDGLVQTPCPASKYCPAASGTPVDCPAGSYCPAGVGSPTACALGKVCAANAAEPLSCPIGYFCPDTLTQTACPLGTYGTVAEATSAAQCTKCSAGTRGVAAGRSSQADGCTTCPSGSNSLAGAQVCFPLLQVFEADDTDSVQTGLSAADVITMRFGADTDEPDVSAGATSPHGVGPYASFVFWTTDLDGKVISTSNDATALSTIAAAAGGSVTAGNIQHSPGLLGDGATGLSAEWKSATRLVIVIAVPPAGLDPALVSIQRGALRAFPAPGILSADGGGLGGTHSIGAANSVSISGTWGVEGDPAVTSAILRDTGGSEGMGPGDTIELQFNQLLGGKRLDTITAEGGTVTGAAAIVELLPHGSTTPLSGWAGTAEWARRFNGAPAGKARGVGPVITDGVNTSAILVTITQAPSWADLEAHVAGARLGRRLSVRVRTSADLRGTGVAAVLPPANNTVVTRGSWGEVPAVPVLLSHSARSAVLTWREPHRPEGQLVVDAWAMLGLDGFLVMWCDAGELPNEAYGRDQVAYARAQLPLQGGNRTTLDALTSAGSCASAYVDRPATDFELRSEFLLPILSTPKVAVRPGRALLVAVSVIFHGIAGPFAPAVDGSPTALAQLALRQGTGGGADLPRAECFMLDFSNSGPAPPGCSPLSPGLSAQDRRACRCRAVVPGEAVERRRLGVVLGSAFSGVVAPALEGVHTSGELGTAGNEFFTILGYGLPVAVPGYSLSSDQEAGFASTLRQARSAAVSLTAPTDDSRLWNPPLPGAMDTDVASRPSASESDPATPYWVVSYGGGTGNDTYFPVPDECTVLTAGLAMRCLSVPGVGREHSISIAVNGVAPASPARALTVPGREVLTSQGMPASAYIHYSAPYIQEFSHAYEQGLPSQGHAQVTLSGRHFGPLGSANIDSVVFSPSRHADFVFGAYGCRVTLAHTQMVCNTTASAGARAYWTLKVAGQDSLLPSTSVAMPHIDSLELVTRDLVSQAAAADSELLRAVAALTIGLAGNTSAADSNATDSSSPAAVLAAFEKLPTASSLDLLPSSGGPLVLLSGTNFGADLSYVSRIWASREDGVTKVMHEHDVDALRQGGDSAVAARTSAVRNCAMVTPHRRVLCRVLPGAGTTFFWRMQVLDVASLSAQDKTSYAPLRIVSFSPAEVASEGTLVTVEAENLPPLGDAFGLVVSFNRGNVSGLQRDAARPLASFSFLSPPVLVGPRPLNDTLEGISSDAFAVEMLLAAAGHSARSNVPVALPSIIRFDADSSRRVISAIESNPPPPAAGGAAAILLEAHGTSFGGYHAGIRLVLGPEECLPLTLAEIAVHLRIPDGGYNPHTQFYCWTSQRSGVPAFSDGADRPATSFLRYDFDVIKTPPTIGSVSIANATTGEVIGSGRGLSTAGGDMLLIRGAALQGVTSVSLLVLDPSSDATSSPDTWPVRFEAPCALIPAESPRQPLCSFVPDTAESSRFCNVESQLFCRSSPGIGGRLFVRAVASSAAAQVQGVSASDLAGFAVPAISAISPSLLPTSGRVELEVAGRSFGLPSVFGAGAGSGAGGAGLALPVVVVGASPCPVVSHNDTHIRCLPPLGIEADALVRVTVEGQQAISDVDGTTTLHAGYQPPQVLGAETFHADDASLGGGAGFGVARTGQLALPTRGGWLRLVGRDFGPSPVVRLIEAETGRTLACVADASRVVVDPGAHNETWCRVTAGDASLYSIELLTAAATPPGRSAFAPFQLAFTPPRVLGVYVDSLRLAAGGGVAANALASSRTVVRQDASAGSKPTPGLFILHIVGSSFSEAPSVTLGDSRCEVVAGVVNPASPLGLGAVEQRGAAISAAAYPPVELDTAGVRSPTAATAALPPVTATAPAGQRRRWVTHELVSCVAPAGTGVVALTVTTSAQRTASVAFSFDSPLVSGALPATAFASTARVGPVANVELSGDNFGTLAQDPATLKRLINVTASLLLPLASPEEAAGAARRTLAARRMQEGLPLTAASPALRAVAAPPTLGATEELCDTLLMLAAHVQLICTPSPDLPVGVVVAHVEVGQQTSADRALLSLCPPGYAGGPGEACTACPEGAFCAGGFAEPQPLPGFFKQAPLSFLQCNPKEACRGAVGAGVPQEDFPFHSLSLGRWQPGVPAPVSIAAHPLRLAGPADDADASAVTMPASDAASALRRLPGAWRESVGAKRLDLEAVFPANGSVTNLLARFVGEAEAVQLSQCIRGYTGRSCAACEERFYRLEGRCEPCPELAWLMIPGFIVALLCLLGVALYLQKKNVQLAGLSVGVDMMQILSVFAALDLNWPIEIRTVWTTVSATTFSLEILAPECSVELDYASKFFAVASIPPLLAVGSLLLVSVDFARRFASHGACPACVSSCKPSASSRSKAASSLPRAPATVLVSGSKDTTSSRRPSAFVGASPMAAFSRSPGNADAEAAVLVADEQQSGSNKKNLKQVKVGKPKSVAADAGHALDAGLGLTLTLLYYVYLTAVRNALQPLDCTEIGASDGSGQIKVMQLEPSVRCDRVNDPTYAAVLPWAVITLLGYGVGIPTIFAAILYFNRETIVADQKLLARGEGHSRASNPNFPTRKRFGRLYADFKPEAFWWRLVLTTRKALVAAVSIMLTGNPTFAAATTALILFVSFLLHNRYQPFLHAPAVSSRFLELAGVSKDAPSAAATEKDKKSTGDKLAVPPKGMGRPSIRREGLSSAAARGRSAGMASARNGCLRLPPWLLTCLRNTSPIFVVCCSDGAAASRQRSTRPTIDVASSARAVTAAAVKSRSIGLSGHSSSALIKRSVSASDSKACPRRQDADGSGSGSFVSAPTAAGSIAVSFAAAAARALQAKEAEEAKRAAQIAQSSSLSFVFDYNSLEGSFLITGVLVLMGGLAFSSNAMPVGSPSYVVIVALIVLLVSSALFSFVWILGFELYRALRFADVLTQAREFQDKILARQRRERESLAANYLATGAGSTSTDRAANRFKDLLKRSRVGGVASGRRANASPTRNPLRKLAASASSERALIGAERSSGKT